MGVIGYNTTMKLLLYVWERRAEIVRSMLSVAGVALTIVGVLLIPIDISYRLVLLGVLSMFLQRAISD